MDRNSIQLNHSIKQGFIFRHTILKKAKQNMLIEMNAIYTVCELDPAYDKSTLLATRTKFIWKYKTKYDGLYLRSSLFSLNWKFGNV